MRRIHAPGLVYILGFALCVIGATAVQLPAGASSPPAISGFNPTSGRVGTRVTIVGSGLTGATNVSFNGVASRFFSVSSDSRINASVPSKALTGPIAVTTPLGTATSSTSFGVIPTVSSFTPTSGSAGAQVIIDGKSFTGASAVTFGGVPAAFVVKNYWRIEATVPNAAATGPIAVTTVGGTGGSASVFTIIGSGTSPPSISVVTPLTGPSGTPVAITGSGFLGTTDVEFNGKPSAFTVFSDSVISASVPLGATDGLVSVTTGGGAASSSAVFDVTLSPQPTISAIGPASGARGSGVALSGSGFTGTTKVTFNGASAAFAVNSDSRLTAAVPEGATDGPLSVTTPGGTATSSGTFDVLFATTSPIEHVVVIVEENHSFNDVLGKFCVEQRQGSLVRAGTNDACTGSDVGMLSGGTPYPLTSEPDVGLTIAHGVPSQETAIDGGAMDGFSLINGCTASSSPAYGCLAQYDPRSGPCASTSGTCIPNIAAYASAYAISDATFTSHQTPTWAGHMVLGSASIERFLGHNPHPYPGVIGGAGWGCDSGDTAPWRKPDGKVTQVPSCVPSDPNSGNLGSLWTSWTGQTAYYEPTIFDRLDSADVSWKIYGGGGTGRGSGYGWTICPAFEACLSGPQSANFVSSVDPATGAFSGGPLATDISHGTLPAVSFVTPTARKSAHQPQAMSAGDNWIGSIVGAIQSNPSLWPNTAIFVTFDDCGCFYDPVNPLQYSPEWGPRTPMLIVSPYAKPGFTDSTPATFGSLLAFVERTFSLPPLNPCASVDAWDPNCSDDLQFPADVDGGVTYAYEHAFNFTQSPLAAVPSVRTPLTPRQRGYLLLHPYAGDEPT